MTKMRVAVLMLAGGLTVSACDSIGQAMTAHTDVLARAAGHELKVDKAASLIALNPQIPAQPDVVVAVAVLWMDYTLLATAAAKDTTLHNIKLDDVIEPAIDQDLVSQLRDKVIHVDTVFTDDQLKKMYDESGIGTQVRARHILLKIPADATPAARDSVMKLAQSLRDQAKAGGNFAELAKKYSADTSAPQGGDLGFFTKDRMIAPFSEAAFKLQPGQISDVVETPYGLHVIKVEERKVENFDSMKTQFVEQAKQKRVQDTEQAYIKRLTDSLKITVKEGAYEQVKQIAAAPEKDLHGRAGSRELVDFKGGAYTARDFQQFVRRLQPQQRAQIPQTPDETLKGFLEQMARNKVLVLEARKQGLQTPPARIDSLKTGIYTQLAAAAQAAGLTKIQPQQGESKDEALERRVNALIEATIKGQQNVIPLGALSYSLREQFDGEVFERAVPAVVAKVEATRPAPQPGTAPQMPMPPVPRDTGRH